MLLDFTFGIRLYYLANKVAYFISSSNGLRDLEMKPVSVRRSILPFTSHARPLEHRKPQRRQALCPSCSQETQKWFYKRLEAQGWSNARQLAKQHEPGCQSFVAEAWAAMDEIYGLGVMETPLEASPWLHEYAGGPASGGSVHLKMESLQPTGSFKIRGATHKLFSLSDRVQDSNVGKTILTSSTGNHALAVLHSATMLAQATGKHVPVRVYVPNNIAPKKLHKLQKAADTCGAEIVVIPAGDCLEAEIIAREAAARGEGVYISPYNDIQVAGAQGTVGLELLMALPPPKIDVVFVPVGGGGLISGVAAVLKAFDPHGIKIVGCQPQASDVMRRAVNKTLYNDEGDSEHVLEGEQHSLSDATVGGVEEGSCTLGPCASLVDEWITVTEQEIASAMVGMHGHHGVAIEGSAGVAVAAYIRSASSGKMKGKHAVIISCGSNVDPDTLDMAYRMVALKPRGELGFASNKS